MLFKIFRSEGVDDSTLLNLPPRNKKIFKKAAEDSTKRQLDVLSRYQQMAAGFHESINKL